MTPAAPPPSPLNARLERLQPLLAELHGVTAAEQTGAQDLSVRAVLDVYAQAVRELRLIALDARGRIERTAAIVAEARVVARRNRRRAEKIAVRRRTDAAENAP